MALKPHWVEDRKMTPEAIEADLARHAADAKGRSTADSDVNVFAPAKKPRGKAKKGD